MRNRLCVVGSSQVSPGPSGPVVDWLVARGDTRINDMMNKAVGITTLDLSGGSNMCLGEGYGVQTQRLPVPRGTDVLRLPLEPLLRMWLVGSLHAFRYILDSPEGPLAESLSGNRSNLSRKPKK